MADVSDIIDGMMKKIEKRDKRIAELEAEVEASRKKIWELTSRLEWRKGGQITHYEGCWRDHYECAMAEVERLKGEVERLKNG